MEVALPRMAHEDCQVERRIFVHDVRVALTVLVAHRLQDALVHVVHGDLLEAPPKELHRLPTKRCTKMWMKYASIGL